MRKSKGRVLIAAQPSALGVTLDEALRQMSYEIFMATTEMEALGLARDLSFDLIVVGRDLDDGTGYDLCRQLSSFSSAPLILFWADNLKQHDITRALCAGAQGFFVTPDQRAEAVSCIGHYLNAAGD